jgi:hypothetical protein
MERNGIVAGTPESPFGEGGRQSMTAFCHDARPQNTYNPDV